jgi:hypothetical protein
MRSLLALSAVGTVAGGAVVFQSLLPSAGTDAALPRVPTSSIQPGAYQFVPDIYAQGQQQDQIMFVRTHDGQLYAWWVPVRDGLHRLPDHHWWKPGIPCRELRPDFEAKVIRCLDTALPDWAKERYRWRLDGKSLSDQAPNMEAIPGVEESSHFVFHKRSAA